MAFVGLLVLYSVPSKNPNRDDLNNNSLPLNKILFLKVLFVGFLLISFTFLATDSLFKESEKGFEAIGNAISQVFVFVSLMGVFVFAGLIGVIGFYTSSEIPNKIWLKTLGLASFLLNVLTYLLFEIFIF